MNTSHFFDQDVAETYVNGQSQFMRQSSRNIDGILTKNWQNSDRI